MTDRDTEHTEHTGLNLFDDRASAAGNFPHAMLGYDKHSVDSYVREVESQVLQLKMQVREQVREVSHVRETVGTTDFTRLGAHATGLLKAAEAQSADIIDRAEHEAERIKTEARRTAAALRESAQQEADDVRLTGLAGLRQLRQEQGEAGKSALEMAKRDADLIVADAKSQAKTIVDSATAQATSVLESARIDAAKQAQEAERAASETKLAAQKDAEASLATTSAAAKDSEAAINERLAQADRHAADAAARATEAREEADRIRTAALKEAEEIRLAATRQSEETLATMRSRARDAETALEEQVAWRREQLNREIASLEARRATALAQLRKPQGARRGVRQPVCRRRHHRDHRRPAVTEPDESLPAERTAKKRRRPRLTRVIGSVFGSATKGAKTLLTPTPLEVIEPVPHIPHDAAAKASPNPFMFGFLGALGVLVALALAQAVLTVQSVLILVVLALFLALGLNPAVDFFTRRRMPRAFAVTLVTLTTLAIIALGVTALVPILTEQTTNLSRNLPTMLNNLASQPQLAEWNEKYDVVRRVQEFITSGNLLNNLFGGLWGAGRILANMVFSVIVTLVLTIYFLASLPTIKETIYAFAPASRRPRAKYLADEIFRGVSGYITGMFVIVSVASLCAFVFMNIAGLGAYSLALSFVVAMFCFIPLVGSSLAMASVALVAFAVNPTVGIATIIYFLIYQQFDAYVLYPTVMRRTVKVPGALVVLSAIIGGMLFGVIGAVIAIPTTAAVLLLFREIVQPALDAS